MTRKDEALKLALEALILKTGMNPVMQGSCYVMHPEALQAVIDEAVKQALAAQPAPVQQKPLFADIIARHPGLAEELKAMDTAPVQEPVAIPEYIRDAAKHLHENRFEPSFMVRAIVGWINGTPPAQPAPVQEPVGYEYHEYRPYGAPGEIRINAILKSRYTMPDGSTAGDYQWLIDQYRASKNTIKLIPLYTTPTAQPAPVPDAIGPNEDELPAYAAGWNDCRQAMLEMMK